MAWRSWMAILLILVPDQEPEKPNRMNADQDESVKLFLCGDVMTGRGIDQVLPQSVDPHLYEPYIKDARNYVRLAKREGAEIDEPVSYEYIWGDALEVWQKENPELRIINLETSLTEHDEPWPDKGINYRMHPENVEVLKAARIDFCSLANNHTLDWERPGLLESLRSLREANIAQAGAGEDLQKANAPAILETGQGRVLVFSYGSPTSGITSAWAATSQQSGVNFLPRLDEEMIASISEQVSALKRDNDLVIFSVHWGSNWGYEVPEEQQWFARQLIEKAEVDLVHGHSSHHPRPVEVHRGHLILYGAGDFINDYEGISGHEQFRDDLCLMYFPELDIRSGKLLSLKMHPMQIRNFQLNSASPEDARWLQNVLNREGEDFGTGAELTGEGILELTWEED